jgi:hypothetical protein
MVGSNNIEPVIEQGFPEGSLIFRRLDGRIAFDIITS